MTKKMKTEFIIKQELQNRIEQIELYLKSAKECLNKDDFLQCAVRLQMTAEQGQFSELLMDVFDSMTKENHD